MTAITRQSAARQSWGNHKAKSNACTSLNFKLCMNSQGSVIRDTQCSGFHKQRFQPFLPIRTRKNTSKGLASKLRCQGKSLNCIRSRTSSIRCRDSSNGSSNVSTETPKRDQPTSESYSYLSNGNGKSNGVSQNGSTQNGTVHKNGSQNGVHKNGNPNMQTSPEKSMNRNSGPKRPKGALSPYGLIQTAEGDNGDSLRNGRKGKERGRKAQLQRGTLDVPENLRKARFFLPILLLQFTEKCFDVRKNKFSCQCAARRALEISLSCKFVRKIVMGKYFADRPRKADDHKVYCFVRGMPSSSCISVCCVLLWNSDLWIWIE